MGLIYMKHKNNSKSVNKSKYEARKLTAIIASFSVIGIALLFIAPTMIKSNVKLSEYFINLSKTADDNLRMSKIRGHKPDNNLFANINMSNQDLAKAGIGFKYSKTSLSLPDYYNPRSYYKSIINNYVTTDKVHLMSLDHKHTAYVKYNPSGKHLLLNRYALPLSQKHNNDPVIYNQHLQLSGKSLSYYRYFNDHALHPISENKDSFKQRSHNRYWQNKQTHEAAYLDKSNAFMNQHLHFYYPLAENLLIRDDSIKRVNINRIPVIISYNPNYELPNIFRRQREFKWNRNYNINKRMIIYNRKHLLTTKPAPSIPFDHIDQDEFDMEYDPDYVSSIYDSPALSFKDGKKYFYNRHNVYKTHKLNSHWYAYNNAFDWTSGDNSWNPYNSIDALNKIDSGNIYMLNGKLSNKPISNYYILTSHGKLYLPVKELAAPQIGVYLKYLPCSDFSLYDADDLTKSDRKSNVNHGIPIGMVLMVAGHYVHHVTK